MFDQSFLSPLDEKNCIATAPLILVGYNSKVVRTAQEFEVVQDFHF